MRATRQRSPACRRKCARRCERRARSRRFQSISGNSTQRSSKFIRIWQLHCDRRIWSSRSFLKTSHSSALSSLSSIGSYRSRRSWRPTAPRCLCRRSNCGPRIRTLGALRSALHAEGNPRLLLQQRLAGSQAPNLVNLGEWLRRLPRLRSGADGVHGNDIRSPAS